jgi:hypothetical protein
VSCPAAPALARGLAIANINYRLVFADPHSQHDEVLLLFISSGDGFIHGG